LVIDPIAYGTQLTVRIIFHEKMGYCQRTRSELLLNVLSGIIVGLANIFPSADQVQPTHVWRSFCLAQQEVQGMPTICCAWRLTKMHPTFVCQPISALLSTAGKCTPLIHVNNVSFVVPVTGSPLLTKCNNEDRGEWE
jgi:hypothetical protein